MSRKLRVALFWSLSPILFPAVAVVSLLVMLLQKYFRCPTGLIDDVLDRLCEFEMWCYRK